MSVNLLTEMHKMNARALSNWSDIQSLIPSRTPPPLLDFAQAHLSTFFKIRFADYHLFILQQIYRPNMTGGDADTQNWARAEMHSIVFNLYSALDSLGNEINLAYGFGIGSGNIHIYHPHTTRVKKCLRCELDNANDNVTSYLNHSLSRHWFEIFRKLRNQITHKPVPVLQLVRVVGSGGGTLKLKLPNDPANSNPDPTTDYSDNLELNQYCTDNRTQVLEIIEYIYPQIKHKIRKVYGI